jgi:hypothetical protein
MALKFSGNGSEGTKATMLFVVLPDGIAVDMRKFLAEVEESERYSRVATAYNI